VFFTLLISLFITQPPSDFARARALFKVASFTKSWPVEPVGSVTHQLLACADNCLSEKPDLLKAWLNGGLSATAIQQHHRGEILATLLKVGIQIDRPIQFDSGGSTTLKALLELHRRALEKPVKPWNEKEAVSGIEYGWLLDAFCQTIGPDGIINQDWTVPSLIEFMLASGINRKAEAGTHELAGLATCLALSKDSVHPVYARLKTWLKHERARALSKMDAQGHVYEIEQFGGCPKPSEEVCRALIALSAQAHYFEWATVVSSPSQLEARALTRFSQLIDQVSGYIAVAGHDELWLMASSHAVNAARQIQRRNHLRDARSR